MKKDFKLILMIFMAGISIFCIFQFAKATKEKYDMQGTLAKMKGEITILEVQKQKLTQDLVKEQEVQQKLAAENAGLSEQLKANTDKLSQFQCDLQKAQGTIDGLNSQVSALNAQLISMKQENSQLTQVTQDRDNLQAKMNSIDELKKAIKELKGQMRKTGKEIKKEVKKKAIKPDAKPGLNYGYIVKDGQSTFSSKVNIQVNPVP
ncbi:MAG: hypothetical protein WCY12_04305 [Candidatus Omnitrophota bacterium]